jgi:hypothetical protein
MNYPPIKKFSLLKRVPFTQTNTTIMTICHYCDQPILPGQPSVPDQWGELGDRLHIGCAAEQQDGDDLNRELED